ncbi:FERM domain-containing protein 8 isoform X2 [Periplaneta americana]|uniref:FERM domain-containing protein 8 isoform X2 n=1 Tax=Periplaneta americana TaxID=6978 RepID=UPI0037E7A1A8
MLENDPHTIHLVTMSATEGMDNHQADNSQNYITVIPVEYPRSRVYPQPPEYLVDQYSDYLRDRTREEYIRGDYNINSEPQFDEVGPLYTVSQRFERDKPHLGASSVGYGTIGHDVDRDRDRDWDRSLHSHTSGSSDTTQQSKESSSAELQSDEQQSSQLVAAKPLKMCIYLMSRVVLHMDLEDGVNITVQELVQSVLQEEELGLPRVAASIFTLWMCSGLLELQLKPHHKPYEICRKWRTLVSQYSTASESRIERDEPVLSFQRNVFFSKRDEEKIKDQKLLDLLYEEARYNILEGRYPCEVSHYIMLGGIQARIELGPYNPQVHTTQFFREQQCKFLPAHVSRSTWSWLRISGKNSPEVRLLEQFKRIPTSTPVRKLVRKYLEFCWSLPYYGGAFFQGQVEQPVRGLTSLITHQDVPVLVAINAQGVYVIDDIQCTLLLGLKYEELSWDFAKPSQEDNPDCLPCLFLQFMVLENGTRVSKILQVFSKQAVMMDALISGFVEELKQKTAAYTDETDRPVYDTSTDSDDTQVPLTMVNRRELPQSCLSNKLSKLTLATFDEDGRCIGQMGSWSFSY